MIDEKKLIDDFQTLAYKERKKCDESAEMGLSDAIVKYSHGEYCYVNAIETVSSQPKIGVWIPCSEPPKHDKEVLIFNGKSYYVGYYDGKTWVNVIRPVEWQEIQHE